MPNNGEECNWVEWTCVGAVTAGLIGMVVVPMVLADEAASKVPKVVIDVSNGDSQGTGHK